MAGRCSNRVGFLPFPAHLVEVIPSLCTGRAAKRHPGRCNVPCRQLRQSHGSPGRVPGWRSIRKAVSAGWEPGIRWGLGEIPPFL